MFPFNLTRRDGGFGCWRQDEGVDPWVWWKAPHSDCGNDVWWEACDSVARGENCVAQCDSQFPESATDIDALRADQVVYTKLFNELRANKTSLSKKLDKV